VSVRRGTLAFALAACAALLGAAIPTLAVEFPRPYGVATGALLGRVLRVCATGLAVYGAYALLLGWLTEESMPPHRRERLRELLRLVAVPVGVVAVLGASTDQWVGALVSLGVVGVAVSLALQQPLLSVLGWAYIAVKRPYRAGDRVSIAGSTGDVVSVDLLVTSIREVDGGLVASNQPSGRLITVPNSEVLASHVANFTDEEFPHVWNEISVQLAYETDLEYAAETAREVATEVVGPEMERAVTEYRDLLADSPVEIDVQDRPTVNLAQRETWVELRVRYVVHPRRGQRVKNELYERLLNAYNENPDRVKFPVGRNR
jgi:small-conductance mechanosensitive channel